MKKFSELSTQEILDLTDETFYKSVQLEAIENKIKIPIELPEIVQNIGYIHATIPADCICLWGILRPKSYGGHEDVGIAFATQEEAETFLTKAFFYEQDYTSKQFKLLKGEPLVTPIYFNNRKQKSFVERIEEFEEDLKDFEELLKNCQEVWRSTRQNWYNRQILLTKRNKYLELANGNKEIAKKFWYNLESVEWPKIENES